MFLKNLKLLAYNIPFKIGLFLLHRLLTIIFNKKKIRGIRCGSIGLASGTGTCQSQLKTELYELYMCLGLNSAEPCVCVWCVCVSVADLHLLLVPRFPSSH